MELFWQLASRVHQKIIGHPLLPKNINSDLERIRVLLEDSQIEFKTLLIAFVFFCRSRDEYLQNKPRNIAVFSGQVEDLLFKAQSKRWAMRHWYQARSISAFQVVKAFNALPIATRETEDPRLIDDSWAVDTVLHEDSEHQRKFKTHALDIFQRYWLIGFLFYTNYQPQQILTTDTNR